MNNQSNFKPFHARVLHLSIDLDMVEAYVLTEREYREIYNKNRYQSFEAFVADCNKQFKGK